MNISARLSRLRFSEIAASRAAMVSTSPISPVIRLAVVIRVTARAMVGVRIRSSNRTSASWTLAPHSMSRLTFLIS